MPLPVHDFQQLTPPSRDIISSLAQGVNFAYMPKILRAEQQKLMLENALKKVNLQFAPDMSAADLEYKRAQTPHLNAQTRGLNLESQFYPQNMMSQIANRNAQTQGFNLQNQFYPDQTKLDLETKRQEILKNKFGLENPLLQQTGTAGQIGALAYLMQHPELMPAQNQDTGSNNGIGDNGQQSLFNPSRMQQQSTPNNLSSVFPGMGTKNLPSPSGSNGMPTTNDLTSLLAKSIFSNLRKNEANTNLNEKRANAYNYQAIPIDQRKYLIAQAGGMGISPQEATERFIKGDTLEDMALEKNYDPNNLPPPIYPATNRDIGQVHASQRAIAELEKLDDTISSAMAPYAQRVHGYSPKQIIDSLSGENEEDLAKFLAARAIQPEMSAIRLKAMGGQVGIEAIKEVTGKAMGEVNIFQSLVSPKVYKKSLDYMSKFINEAAKVSNEVGLQPGLVNKKSTENNSDRVRVRAPNGQMLSVPSDKVDMLLKDHPDHTRVE